MIMTPPTTTTKTMVLLLDVSPHLCRHPSLSFLHEMDAREVRSEAKCQHWICSVAKDHFRMWAAHSAHHKILLVKCFMFYSSFVLFASHKIECLIRFGADAEVDGWLWVCAEYGHTARMPLSLLHSANVIIHFVLLIVRVNTKVLRHFFKSFVFISGISAINATQETISCVDSRGGENDNKRPTTHRDV